MDAFFQANRRNAHSIDRHKYQAVGDHAQLPIDQIGQPLPTAFLGTISNQQRSDVAPKGGASRPIVNGSLGPKVETVILLPAPTAGGMLVLVMPVLVAVIYGGCPYVMPENRMA